MQAEEVSGTAFLRNVLTFGRELRAEGLAADLATVLDYARALDLVDIGAREEVRAAGAALFVRRRDELEPYERAFARFWRARRRSHATGMPSEPQAPGPEPARWVSEDLGADLEAGRSAGPLQTLSAQATLAEEDDASEADDRTVSPTSWSASDALKSTSFERMTADELHEAERAIDALAPAFPLRRSRRWKLHPHGKLLAPREMMRRNLSAGGDLVEWVWRRPVRQPRGVVLLCDISGSMERYSRLLLRFGHALSRSSVPTEAFAFGTRLTRITPVLRARDPNAALAAVAEAVGDWSGGTRIGHSFAAFNQLWARRVLRSSGIVIVVSDGWDRGDPAQVAAETARLRRNSYRLIWLNPLAGSVDYRPLAMGMAAALPHVDVFLPAHNLASLEHLATMLGQSAWDAVARVAPRKAA